MKLSLKVFLQKNYFLFKRNSVNKAVIASISFFVLCFSSCEDFMNSSELSQKLKDNIEYSNAENVSVRVDCDINSGATIPKGDVTEKPGYYFDISYTPLKQYFFKNWTAVYKSTGKDASHLVDFKDAASSDTQVKLLTNNKDILIKPVYVNKPAVLFTVPTDSKDGLVRNTTVKISFSKPIDPSTLTNDNILIEEGSQKIINNEIEFVSTDVNNKFKTFSLSPSGKVLSLELVENQLFKAASTVKVTLSKNIKDLDGASLQEDFVLRFSVGSYIDGLAPRIKTATAGVKDGDYSSINLLQSYELLDSDVQNETIENIQNLPMNPLTLISRDKINIHVEAADISGYGSGQSVTENESDVSSIYYRMVCLYKLENGKLVKTNSTDNDFYDVLNNYNYNSGGCDLQVSYPEYEVNEEEIPAPDGLYRIDVFAVDKNNNSGLTEKYASEYGNGYSSFYVLRDNNPLQVKELVVKIPHLNKNGSLYFSKDDCISINVIETGVGILQIKAVILDSEDNDVSHCDVESGEGTVKIKYNSTDDFSGAKELSLGSRTKNELNFKSLASNNLLTEKNSGYYYLTGLTDGLTEGQKYKLKLEITDASGCITAKETELIVDNTNPWFIGGDVNPLNTTGFIVKEYTYTKGTNAENVFPRKNQPGITSASFWDSPVINNGNNIPVRWFYTNSDKNGKFGVYLETGFFDNIAIEEVKYIYNQTAPLSDSEFAIIKALDIALNGSLFVSENSDCIKNEHFFETGTYSFVIIDKAGNISPAFTFTVVLDNVQPEIVTAKGSDINYLMTLEFDGRKYVGGTENYQKNRYAIGSDYVSKWDYLYDWYDGTVSHSTNNMIVRDVSFYGTKDQVQNAKIRFNVSGNAPADKDVMLGHKIDSRTPALKVKQERYNDAKPGRTNSGIAQYYLGRQYVDWRAGSTDNTTLFQTSFPPETDLDYRFTGGKQLFIRFTDNNKYKYSRSYAGDYADYYFDTWKDYTAGEDILIPVYKNQGKQSLNYQFCPPITLCFKDNCGNIKTRILTRPNWEEYAPFIYRFYYDE